MFYYVIQSVNSEVVVHGPYKSEQARDNRFENIHGGEIHKFNSFSEEPIEVRQEFRDEISRKAFK